MSQAFSGMDLELLVGEPVDPAELSDDIFANMLDRFWEADSKKTPMRPGLMLNQ